jgi:hypothetical protein
MNLKSAGGAKVATSSSRDPVKQRRTTGVQRNPGAHADPLRDTLARELLGVCMATLKSYGLNSRRLAQLALEATSESTGRISRATAVLAEAQRLADAASKWVEDPAYRDATGRPAVLSVRDGDSCSFAALAHEFFPEWAVADVLALGCKANVLERIGSHKVALLNSTVLFTGNSLPILAYSIRTVRRFLCTAEFNRRARLAALEGWPDRTSFVNVAEDDFREFIRVFRPQISGLIEMSNRWLFQRSRLSRNRHRRKRLAGLHLFVFRE